MMDHKYKSATDSAKEIRSLIEFELTRLDDRIKTLFTVQGLMFVALSFAWEKDKILTVCLIIAGMIAVLALGAIAQTSVDAINTMEKHYNKMNSDEIDDGRSQPWSSVQHSKMRFLGMHPIFWIGMSVGIIWCGLFIVNVIQFIQDI
jgi:hypothetical protein